MTSFLLKIIGIVTMLCDHTGDTFIGHFSFLNLIGRIAFPIFAFQIVQGYMHTHNVKKYALRLFAFACISQIPFMLFLTTFYDSFYLNIFFTLLLGIICLYGYDKIKNKYLGILFSILICIVAHFIQVDYGAYGVAVIFLFYIFNKTSASDINATTHCDLPISATTTNQKQSSLHYKKITMCLVFIILTSIKYLPDIVKYPSIANIYIACVLFTSISLIPIYIYNGKQGPKTKYLFYAFYPVHLLLLYFLVK
ncbi:MAG: hypothetical protein HFJ42_09895 [Clostridia bacterium]|nr:hypothetical protein [Clostridia bacterium]